VAKSSKSKKRKKMSKSEKTTSKNVVPYKEKDLASEVLDDGYIDVMEDKTVSLFVVGDVILPSLTEKSELSEEEITQSLLEEIPEISDYCNLDTVKQFRFRGNIPTPAMMLDLSKSIQKALSNPDVAGVVVTQAPDAIEESAYFVSISLSDKFQNSNSKPIVFTSAMFSDVPFHDGGRNLLDSVRTACHDGKGDIPTVVICMNSEIHAASRAQISHTINAAALSSPGWGPVGYADKDRVYFRAGALELDTGLNFPTPKRLSASVEIIKAQTGDTGLMVDAAVKAGADALIIEGFGRGNLPGGMMPSIKKALKKGVLVVIATRAASGRVLDSGDYCGSVTECLDLGCLLAGETTAAKARLLMMYILSQKDAAALRKSDEERFLAYVQECLDPVLSVRLFE
jgi:L-asparaginase/archaeal Glu-tRNAGln amidotransferase subunit D